MELMIRDLPIYYDMRGEGKPILFLHGQPTDHVVMLNSFEPLFEEIEGYQRIYVDFPGMGNTPGADWITSYDDYVELMHELIETLAPNQNYIIVGFSFGGYIGRGLALRYPEQCEGLMLIAPAIGRDASKRQIPETNIIVENPDLYADLPEQVQATFSNAIAVQTEYVVERARNEILPAIMKADHEFLGRVRAGGDLSDIDAINAATFDKPGLFLLGRQDFVVGYADAFELHDKFPRTSIVALDRCGHGPTFAQPVLFEALTKEWLFRVEEMRERALSTM